MTTSKEVLHQTLACSLVIFNQFLIGVGWGWTAPTLTKLTGPDAAINVTSEQLSWLASINEVGRVLGPFVSPPIVDNLGRRYTHILITVSYFLVWLSIIFVNDIYLLCVARLFFGLVNGINDVAAGIYTTENCSPTLRGILGGIVQLAFFVAMFIEFVVATCLSYTQTAIANAIMAACVFATFYWSVETPYFLTMKGERDTAEENLFWLSGDVSRAEVADEMRRIERSVAEEKQKTQSLKSLISSTANLKGIVVVVGMHILGTMTGGTAFWSYASLIYSPSETLTVNQYMILSSVVQFVAVGVSPFIVEQINRRSLIIGCHAGFVFSNVTACLLTYARNHGYELAAYPWLIFGAISSYSIFGGLMGSAGYALKGELLPLSVRSIGTSMAVTGQSIASFCMVKVFFSVAENYGMEMNFVMFSVASLLITFFLYYLMPETRGRTLHELQNMEKSKDVVEVDESSDLN